MKELVYLYFLESFVLFYLVTLGLFHNNNEIYSMVVISIFSIEFFYYFYKCNKKKSDVGMILLFGLALALRLAIMYYDIYVSTIEVADSGDYRIAAENYFRTNIVAFRGRTFSVTTLFMGILYKIYGLQRIVLPYAGTMCFMGACHLTNEILKKTEVRNSVRYICMFWMLFTPQNVEITSLSNREGYIIFLTTLSIYYLVMWWKKKKKSNIVKGIIALGIAMLFHSGVVTIFVGYLIIMAFYNKKDMKIDIKWNSIIILGIVIILFGILFINYKGVLFNKFAGIDELSDISGRAGYSKIEGATYYVPGEGASSLGEIVLYTPIRSIYFMLSPMPWNWRGLSDVCAFAMCSIPHIIIGITSIKQILKKETEDKRKSLLIILGISAIAIAIVFGWGVKNAGTAIRHRDKFLCLYTILLGIGIDMRYNEYVNRKKSMKV